MRGILFLIFPNALVAFSVFPTGIKDKASIPKFIASLPASPKSKPSLAQSAPNSARDEPTPMPVEARLAPGTNPSPTLAKSAIAAPNLTLSEVLITPPASVISLSLPSEALDLPVND